jgi:hypothetical protein
MFRCEARGMDDDGLEFLKAVQPAPEKRTVRWGLVAIVILSALGAGGVLFIALIVFGFSPTRVS